ncbi:MAG: hypothetical protein WCX32_00765 [Clostridia bacterium]|jgi:hypothetical protein|nr:hypothetical protein [Clostridia bacterium]MDD4276228.1 hypothetical protein [Clostridia bacterium]
MIKSNTKKGCLFILLGILITIVIIVVALYLGFKNTSSTYLEKFGISSIGELIDIVDSINEPINENDLIKNGFSANDYLTAKTKLINSGINMFDSTNGDIDIEKINATNEFVPVLSLELTEAELGALINNATKNIDAEFISEDYEIIISLISFDLIYSDSNNVVLDCVIKADTSNIKAELGILQSLMPESLYLSFSVSLSAEENYNVSVSDITINKLTETKNEKVLNVLCSLIKSRNTELEVYTIVNLEADFANSLENCINALMQKITGTTIFTINGIELNIAG